jgi:hypothetical protein
MGGLPVESDVVVAEQRLAVHEVLKELSLKTVNPFAGLPLGSDAIMVFNALNDIFQAAGYVFSGSVSEIVELASKAGVSERRVRAGFQEMGKHGFVQVVGDQFIPQLRWLNLIF